MSMPNDPYVKPVVFFSHSSRDKAALVKLRDCFVEKTGSSIDVFLSSDGQSIRLGKNWVHAVEAALRNAKLMFVFLTPESVRSQWVLFEVGCAYGRNLQVIPVGMWGVDVGAVGAPLNLLQGFNVTSPESLSNIIAETNRTFGLTHKDFDSTDYATICAEGPQVSSLGKLGSLFDRLCFQCTEISCNAGEALQQLADAAKAAGFDVAVLKDSCHIPGLSAEIYWDRDIQLVLDSSTLRSTLPLVNAWLAAIRPAGAEGLPFFFVLNGRVGFVFGSFRISGRLFSAGVRFGKCVDYLWEDVSFDLSSEGMMAGSGWQVRVGDHLLITPRTRELSIKRVAALVDLLLEREILFFKS
jgi:hypothetical protein